MIVHVHIAFARRLFRPAAQLPTVQAVEELGAVKRGTWGAAPLPASSRGMTRSLVMHKSNSAFRRTALETLLTDRGIERVHVMGLATQFSVEHTGPRRS